MGGGRGAGEHVIEELSTDFSSLPVLILKMPHGPASVLWGAGGPDKSTNEKHFTMGLLRHGGPSLQDLRGSGRAGLCGETVGLWRGPSTWRGELCGQVGSQQPGPPNLPGGSSGSHHHRGPSWVSFLVLGRKQLHCGIFIFNAALFPPPFLFQPCGLRTGRIFEVCESSFKPRKTCGGCFVPQAVAKPCVCPSHSAQFCDVATFNPWAATWCV